LILQETFLKSKKHIVMKYLKQLFFVLSLLFIQNTFCQSTVYVQTDQYGRGFLKMRGSECFVITPEHLLKKGEKDYNGPIQIFGESGVNSRANLKKSFLGDLAILEFSGTNNQNCTKWQIDKNYSTVINNSLKGYLELRETDGSATKHSVKISNVDLQYIYIQFEDSSEDFYQGMSGSSLFVSSQGKKVFLGMLQSIEKDEITGKMSIGKVIRADEIDKLLSGFFNPVQQLKKSRVISENVVVKEVSDFRFELLDIEKSGSRVTFNFDVTSLKSDKILYLRNRDIFLYDDKGSESIPDNIVLANRTQNYGYIEHKLIKDTPVSLKITFNNVSSSAQFATLFKIGLSDKITTSNFEFKDLYFGDESEDFEEKGNWSEETLDFKFDLLSFEKTGIIHSFCR